jgi:predicted amidohydrolase YtcJ
MIRVSSWLGAAAGMAMAAAAQAEPPPTVYYDGQIDTPQGWQSALAVAGDRILAIGPDAAVIAAAGKHANLVDLHGQTVMAGLHDMHVHPQGGGFNKLQCSFAQGLPPAQILAFVKGCVSAAKPGEWIVGGQWQAISFGATPPNKAMLDSIAPDNPVFLYDISGHSAWVNSAALKAAGIDRATPPPVTGGVIEHDAAGDPTGILRENATAMVGERIPPASPEVQARALKLGLDTLLAFGVTELTDAMVGKDLLTAYDTLYDRGELKQRVRGCIVYGKELGKGAAFEEVLAHRQDYVRPLFRDDCVKVFMDGVPTESHTAAMLEPYARSGSDVERDPARVRGLLLLKPAELDPLIARMDRMGLNVKFHSVGDWASETALDAIEKARASNGPGGPHHDLGHLTFIRHEDIVRAKRLGVTLEYSPYLWFPSAINDDIIKAIGPARIARVWPVKEGVDAGALVVAGSDWEVVPSPNPWIGIETLVTRRAPDGARPGEVYGPDEAITLRQAIDIFTINAARHLGNDKDLGSLEPGKIADFIVIDRNPFQIPITDVHKVVVNRVFVGGRQVYARDSGSPGDQGNARP